MGGAALHQKLNPVAGLLKRHWEALLFVLGVVIPLIVRYRRRPVIFSRYAGLGDIICTLPAVQEIMKRHSGAAFIYNCHRDFVAIPRLAGVADRIVSLKEIGLVEYWYPFLLGGYYEFRHSDDVSGSGCKGPIVAEFCRQFDVPVTDEHPELPVTPAAKARALAILVERGLDPDELVLIHPGPSWPVREWPKEKWDRLIGELRGRGWANIGQLGVGRYVSFGKVDVPLVQGAVSLVDAFTVEECIAVIAQAALFIGIDSGLLHIAAGTRTPSVGIFGMTIPEYRFSSDFRRGFVSARIPCAGCEHRQPRLHWVTGCPFDIECMKTMDEMEVLHACLAKLPRVMKHSEIPSSKNTT